MGAAQYDSWYDSPLGAACLEAEVALLQRGAGDLIGKSVLEVGCGTGRFLQVFGREAVRAEGIPTRHGLSHPFRRDVHRYHPRARLEKQMARAARHTEHTTPFRPINVSPGL
jgi:hypothetical protein